MTKIPIKEVIVDIKSLFGLNEENKFGSMENEDKFYINKQHFERFEVIGKLQNYFEDKFIDGGYVKVSPITMIFTSFEVKVGKPELT